MIGMFIYWFGASNESLAVIGYAYLVLFDAFGILNNFISSVLKYNPAFSQTCTKRPFGVKRFEIVFALVNTIFLLFGTMFTTKETLEHLLVEDGHHSNHHDGFPFGLLFILMLGIGASFGASTKLGNHDSLLNLTKRSKGASEYNEKMSFMMESPIQLLSKNIYSLSIVATGAFIFFINLVGLNSMLDKFVALGEACLMGYLGGPTAFEIAKILLQTIPEGTNIDYYLRNLKDQIPAIISIDKVHFWQNEYGKLIGTLEIQSRADANEDDIISQSLHILEPFTKDGEITISVTKAH